MVDPIDYTGGLDRAIQSGARLGGLIGLAQQQELANQKAADAQALTKQFQADWQTSFGDPTKMTALAAKYPGQMEAIKAGIGFQDEQHQIALGNAARDLRIAIATGNPQAVQGAAMKHVQTLGSINSSPDEILQQFQQDPQSLAQTVDAVGMSALGAKDYYGVENDRAQRQNDQAKLAEQMRSNRASEGLQGQQIAVSRENSIRSAYAPTSAMQNFNQYAQMLKSDPDGAAVFAQAAGINTAGKKLMKVEKNDDGSVTKYYTDGTEEAGKLNQPISGDGFKPISMPQAQIVLEKAPEGAKKSGGFAYRVRQNLDAIDGLKVDPKRIALINTALGQGSSLGNLKMSGPEQQYVAYAGDAIAAILRQESGAAIPIEEQQSYYKRYFPQIGDSDATVKTKRNLLENQFKALRGASGRAYDALNVVSAADAGSQPQQAQQTTARPAPEKAIRALQSDPSLAPQFRAKYGYLP